MAPRRKRTRTPQPPLVQPPPPRQQSQPPAPQFGQQELSRPPRPRVVTRYILPPLIVQATPENFAATVRRLTGPRVSPSTTLSSSSPYTSAPAPQLSPGSLFPATWGAARVTDNANISNELGFVGSVETIDQYNHHQNQEIDRPLSWFATCENAGPTSMPLISPDFFSPVAPTDPQDGYYWNQQRHQQQAPIPHGGSLERPRFDFGHGMHNSYLSLDELNPQSGQGPSIPSEEVGPFNGASMGILGGNNIMSSPAMSELLPRAGGILPPEFGSDGRPMGFGQQYVVGRPGPELLHAPPDFGPDGRPMDFGQQDLVGRPGRELLHVPLNASSTLFVQGLPSDCSRRELERIFLPFSGYREVRLVTKDSKHRDGDNIVLCFVDFDTPASAANALNALQGYRMDEEDPGSNILRL